jgi:hypothetical protein
MAAEQITVTLDAGVFGAATRVAEREGLDLSSWFARLIEVTTANAEEEHARAIADGLAAVAEFEAEHGAFTPEELAWADQQWQRLTSGVRPFGES